MRRPSALRRPRAHSPEIGPSWPGSKRISGEGGAKRWNRPSKYAFKSPTSLTVPAPTTGLREEAQRAMKITDRRAAAQTVPKPAEYENGATRQDRPALFLRLSS